MAKIVHLTSVHSSLDPRVFEKECVTLAADGHTVVLIAADGTDSRTSKGVTIRIVKGARRRLTRMLVTAFRVFRAALRERADAYHFHDPELMPWAWLLRLRGYRVTYDVHEDYVSGIAQKTYIPRPLRALVAGIADQAERLSARTFHIVLAERYYLRRFPGGVMILNYPVVREPSASPLAFTPGSNRLLYTGNVTEDRGALNHAGLLAVRGDVDVHLIGRCNASVAEAMRDRARGGGDRLILEGIGTYVPFDRIRAAYQAGGWLCGLAVFPSTPHYHEKELTKFFEYMLAGLPIVCSDFPVWRNLVEGEGVGLCVPPADPQALSAAIDWLKAHPAEAEEMGRAGQRLVRERFNWGIEARKLLDFYARILAHGPGEQPTVSAPHVSRHI